jgi:hypothetical protein
MPSRWCSLPFLELDAVPSSPGVFVIYGRGVLLYVGQSTDMLSRLRALRTSIFSPAENGTPLRAALAKYNKAELRLKYERISRCGDWLSLEYRLIAKLRPPLNSKSPTWFGTPKAEETARRSMVHDYCLKCHTQKKHCYMHSKTWCKRCFSFAPAEWRQSGETSFHYKKQTAKTFVKTLVPRANKGVTRLCVTT